MKIQTGKQTRTQTGAHKKKLQSKSRNFISLGGGLGLTSLIAACSGDKANNSESVKNPYVAPLKSFGTGVFSSPEPGVNNKAEIKLQWDNNNTTTIYIPDFAADSTVNGNGEDLYNLDVGFSEAIAGRLDLIVKSIDFFNNNNDQEGVYIFWDIEKYKNIEEPNANYLAIKLASQNSPYSYITFSYVTFATDKVQDNFILVASNDIEEIKINIFWNMEQYRATENRLIDVTNLSSKILSIKHSSFLYVDGGGSEEFDLQKTDYAAIESQVDARIKDSFGGNEDLAYAFDGTNGLNYDFDGKGKNDIRIEVSTNDFYDNDEELEYGENIDLIVFGEKQATGTFDLGAFMTNTATFTEVERPSEETVTITEIADQFISADLDESGEIEADETNFAAIITSKSNRFYSDRDEEEEGFFELINYSAIADAIAEIV